MDKKMIGIIALIVTILFCGLPGLCGLCGGPLFVIVGLIPGAEIDIFGSSDPKAAIAYGIGTLCVSVLFIAIPVVIGYLTLRKKSAAVATETESDLPPSI
jgi:hypothetical protein